MEQTDGSQSGRGVMDWKRLTNIHICIYAKPMNTDKNVGKARGRGGGLVEGERGGNEEHL